MIVHALGIINEFFKFLSERLKKKGLRKRFDKSKVSGDTNQRIQFPKSFFFFQQQENEESPKGIKVLGGLM